MYRSLTPCPWCSRHVRADDRECPFCLGVLARLRSPQRPRPKLAGLSRATLLAGSITLLGCGGATPGPAPAPAPTAPDDDGGMVALYGATAPEPEDREGDNTTEPKPDVGEVSAPVYGAPPQPEH